MRILEIMGTSTGGVRAHVWQAADLLHSQGDEVAIAGPSQSFLPDRNEAIPTYPLAISDRPGTQDQATIRQIRDLAKDYDVVHAHGLRAGALSALAVKKMDAQVKPRLIVTLHNRVSGSLPLRVIGTYLLRTVCRNADVVLAVSADVEDAARAAGAKEVMRPEIPTTPQQPSGKTPGEVYSEIGVASDSPMILTIARLAPEKNLGLLLDAADALVRSGAKFTWVVAGSGPLEPSLKEQIAARKLPMLILGQRNDIPDLLRVATVVVSTAYWEGQPIGLQEALRAGKPIIATDGGGTKATVGSGGVIVGFSVDEMAKEIEAVLDDPAQRAELQQRAYTRSQQLATPESLLTQLNAVYR